MNPHYLDFEQPIAELEEKIKSLQSVKDKFDIKKEMESLQAKSNALIKKTFSSLSAWQIVQLARHPQRPHTIDYIDSVFDEFVELRGDRTYADDAAIVGGMAKLDNISLIFIGQQKGRTTKEKIKYNFGMPRPEGYRKALRLMKIAEKFSMPIITFIDTPGAYHGVDAEQRGQSEAIANNLFHMTTLKTPIITVIIGEGGSGGALAIGVADRLIMFEYSVYSVISPEGCASILYKDVGKANIAAEALKLTSACLKKEGLIDVIINEPLGGIHRNVDDAYKLVKDILKKELQTISTIAINKLVKARETKILSFGKFTH